MTTTQLPPNLYVVGNDASNRARHSKQANVDSCVAHGEAVAHAVLRLTGEQPGQLGRVRTARVVLGKETELEYDTRPYAVAEGWLLRHVVELIDALIEGNILAQTTGPRPTLVLTLPGFCALEALETS